MINLSLWRWGREIENTSNYTANTAFIYQLFILRLYNTQIIAAPTKGMLWEEV